jgi:hypothetical protein
VPVDERVGCADMRRLPGDRGLAYRESIAVRAVLPILIENDVI